MKPTTSAWKICHSTYKPKPKKEKLKKLKITQKNQPMSLWLGFMPKKKK